MRNSIGEELYFYQSGINFFCSFSQIRIERYLREILRIEEKRFFIRKNKLSRMSPIRIFRRNILSRFRQNFAKVSYRKFLPLKYTECLYLLYMPFILFIKTKKFLIALKLRCCLIRINTIIFKNTSLH